MRGSAAAPASSGNLGPGFDVLALALDLMCVVSAEPADSWQVTQEGSTYRPEPGDFARRAVAAVVDGAHHLRIDSAIPPGRGLGSSSALAVAAAAAALRAKGEEPDSQHLFEVVAGIEGHADNAAAAVYGGLVVVGGGVVRSLDVHPDLRILVAVPATPLETIKARSVLPANIGRSAAARSLARVVFLIEGLRTGDPAALAAAAGDELHEEPRRELSPLTARLIEGARTAGAFHAAWSGAGPSVIAFVPEGAEEDVAGAMRRVLGGAGDVLGLTVAPEGWR